MHKEQYETPKIQIDVFHVEDVIQTSPPGPTPGPYNGGIDADTQSLLNK